MKLLYITNQICGSGGLERVLSIKTSYLTDVLNYEIHIITLNQNDAPLFYDFSKKLIYHDISARGNPINYALKYLSGLKKTIKRINPDIILVCDDGLKGLLLSIILRKPCPMVYERHVSRNIEIKTDKPSLLIKIKSYLKYKIMIYGGSKYDKFIVLTNGNKSEWPLKNLQVIPNPLSFYPKEQSSLLNKKVLAVGKQSYQKGYDRLLQTWKLVSKKHPDWQLEIYGTIDEKQNLYTLAKELDIEETVTFFKPVKNINNKYKEASIYAMSSRFEGFGMVLTEAMAYGVPCVSFDCPHGPSDIITNDHDGYLIPNGNIQKMSEAICKLIRNEQTRLTMGKKARINVLRYQPEVILPKWDNLFKNETKNL